MHARFSLGLVAGHTCLNTSGLQRPPLPVYVTMAANSKTQTTDEHILFPLWSQHVSINSITIRTLLGLLLCGGLGGHVDGGCRHGDGAPAGHQVEIHGCPGDVGGRHLDRLGQAQVGAEPGHEVPGGDEVHAGLQRLQDQLEAPADLLLGDPRDGADLCEG